MRIQLRRTKGWRLPPNAMVVSRPSRWGNPYKVGVDGQTRDGALKLYADWLDKKLAEDPAFLDPLIGKNLACWCPKSVPQGMCHADILLSYLWKQNADRIARLPPMAESGDRPGNTRRGPPLLESLEHPFDEALTMPSQHSQAPHQDEDSLTSPKASEKSLAKTVDGDVRK